MPEKKKIFIAEDDVAGLESLKKLLSLSGFEVEGTPQPKEIMSLIKSFMPDLILLDLMMPQIGGLEICQMLNDTESTKGIPIIIISALGGHGDIKNAYKLGVVAYHTKPYDFEVLMGEIDRCLEMKKEKKIEGD